MTQALSVPLAALMATLAGVVGTQLGRDTVAEIKPLFFSELPEPPQIDQDTSEPMRFGVAGAPTDAGWGYHWAREPVCWGCPEKPERVVDPYGDMLDTPIPTAGHAEVRQVREMHMAEEQQEDATSKDVRRYLDFPITEDEARRSSRVAEQPRQRQGQLADDLRGKRGDIVGM
jgi:hypothetical protein